MLTDIELNNLEQGIYFNKKYLIGEGFCSKVYKINNKYVVKKIINLTGINWFDLLFFNFNFTKELEATIELSLFDISPKVVYHSKPNKRIKYIVIEKLDYTLSFMLKNKTFNSNHLLKLKKKLNNLKQTRYFHNDLHFKNIMWSESLNDFRIIDWGNYFVEDNLIENKTISKRYQDIIKLSTLKMNNLYKTYKIFGIELYKTKY